MNFRFHSDAARISGAFSSGVGEGGSGALVAGSRGSQRGPRAVGASWTRPSFLRGAWPKCRRRWSTPRSFRDPRRLGTRLTGPHVSGRGRPCRTVLSALALLAGSAEWAAFGRAAIEAEWRSEVSFAEVVLPRVALWRIRPSRESVVTQLS